MNWDPSRQLLEHGSPDDSTPCQESSRDVISSPTKRKKFATAATVSSVGENQLSDAISSQIDPTAYINTHKVGGVLGVANQQLLHVHEAFAGDDVVGDFAREKEAAEEAGQEEASLTLPGDRK